MIFPLGNKKTAHLGLSKSKISPENSSRLYLELINCFDKN